MIAMIPALAKEPGQVAIDFLEKVREGKVDLKAGADTALSPHITERKRKLIEESIENLSTQIGKGKLTVGKTRMDGDFAAVMVMQGEGVDQGDLQVYPVALVKGENGWRAAPILASFENAVSAYTVPLRERLTQMELWMMQQRVLEIESLMMRATERMKKQIKSHFQAEDLTTSDPVKILDRFQKAYSEGRQNEALGYLGGYSEEWPSDWDLRMEVMRVAFSQKVRDSYPWRLLSSPDVVRVVVGESVQEEEGLVSLACLDPKWGGARSGAEAIYLVHFSFSKDEQDKWRLDLPESFLRNDHNILLESQGMDDDLLDQFTERLRKSSPPRFAENFELVEQEVVGQLESGSLREVLRWVNLDGDSAASRKVCLMAANDWWSFHAPGEFRSPIKLGTRVVGDWGVVAYHWFSLNNGERFELKPLFFRNTPKGWVWVPGSVTGVDTEVGVIFSGWMKREQGQWQANAKKSSLESVVSLKSLPLDRKVEDAEVRELAQQWGLALKQKNIRALFGMSVRLGDAGTQSQKVFRNLVYELAMAQRAKSELTGVYRAGKWVAAGVAHGEGEEKVFSLMLTVSTDKGLKVLSEIDLISDSSRTRKFLNKVSLERLKPFVSGEELEEVEGLFREFEDAVR